MSQQVDPNTNLNNFLKQWEEANQQYALDYSYLINALAQMLAEAKSGNVQEAFQQAELAVMPAAMQVQGDTMGQLGAAMNISSALQQFTTDAENDVNAGENMTKAQAEQFVKLLKDLYNKINTTPPPPWLDKNTQANLLQAIRSICGNFHDANGNPITDPNKLNPNQVLIDIVNWVAHPTDPAFPGNPNYPQTGQQMLQNLQSGLTQWNNTESAQSQGLQAQEQFAANTFNQYLNTCMDIFKSTQQQNQAMIQNQKSN